MSKPTDDIMTTPDEQYAAAVQVENRKIERKMIAAQVLAALYVGLTDPNEDLAIDFAGAAVEAADALLDALDQ